MGTEMAVAFANIFMAGMETKMIGESNTKEREWKRYIDDIFPLWVFQHIENKPVYKLTISTLQSSCLLKSRRGKHFLTQLYFKGERIENKSILDITTHNPTEIFTKIIT